MEFLIDNWWIGILSFAILGFLANLIRYNLDKEHIKKRKEIEKMTSDLGSSLEEMVDKLINKNKNLEENLKKIKEIMIVIQMINHGNKKENE